MSDISRVVMLWPADLKAEIQAEVGKRGLTQYVLQAVREKRGLEPPRTAPAPVQVPVERPSDGVAPPVAHTGHLPLVKVREIPDVIAKCSTCDAELNPDGTCWVCG